MGEGASKRAPGYGDRALGSVLRACRLGRPTQLYKLDQLLHPVSPAFPRASPWHVALWEACGGAGLGEGRASRVPRDPRLGVVGAQPSSFTGVQGSDVLLSPTPEVAVQTPHPAPPASCILGFLRREWNHVETSSCL